MTTRSKGADFWEQHLSALQASGRTMGSYAREHGLSAYTMSRWRRKLWGEPSVEAGSTKVTSQPSMFVALKVADPVVGSMNVTLAIGGEVRLQMSELPSPAWLAALSGAMRGIR